MEWKCFEFHKDIDALQEKVRLVESLQKEVKPMVLPPPWLCES